ncbi:NUDIX hydrolase [Simkania sp.]|uniref:NUDIX hydrolase n=1 Tax=Simkania sp. TaxID=34094 RepID=UPI003B521FD2
MQKHFVTSVYILQDNQVLLLMHPKLSKWLPPGGHVEENEAPVEAALREVEEETGLLVELISDEHVWIEKWNANSFHRPFLCLLEEIPPYKDQAAHQHIDLIYLARPLPNSQIRPTPDHPLRWFTFEEVQALSSDEEIFAETQEVIQAIMEHQACQK